MREAVLRYLGFRSDAMVDELTNHLIDMALHDIESTAEFRYVDVFYDIPQPFMQAHSAYMDYLAGSEGYLLCACTLGVAVDRRLKRLQMEDMAYAVVLMPPLGHTWNAGPMHTRSLCRSRNWVFGSVRVIKAHR